MFLFLLDHPTFLHNLSPLRNENSDSDGSTSGEAEGSGEVDLKLAHLESYFTKDGQKDTSEYAKNGSSVKRIQQLLDDPPCECECRLPLNVCAKICKTFWNLPKQSQDALLWSLQSGSGRKSKWCLEGVVCLKVPLFLVL